MGRAKDELGLDMWAFAAIVCLWVWEPFRACQDVPPCTQCAACRVSRLISSSLCWIWKGQVVALSRGDV